MYDRNGGRGLVGFLRENCTLGSGLPDHASVISVVIITGNSFMRVSNCRLLFGGL